jgi:cytoskeletal protein CcmA (bactofilin family)
MVIRTGETYSLESYTTLEDDLYIGAGTVSLLGTTTGDVFVGGSHVTLKGVVGQDLLIFAGDVHITGNVLGDFRALSGEVHLDGHVTEDVFLGAGTVVISQGSVIDGDLFIYADNVEYRGVTEGEVKIHARVVQIKGVINGSADITVRESLSLVNTASIKGDLLYQSPKDAFIPNEESVEGKIHYNETTETSFGTGVNFISFALKLLMAVFASVLFVYMFPRYSRRIVDVVVTESPWNVAKGGVLLLAWPIFSLMLIFTLLGTLLGFVMLFAFGFVCMLAAIFAPVIAGVILARWFKYEEDELKLAWVSLGAIVFVTISLISVIGFVVELLLFLFAFYAVCTLLYENIWKNRKLEIGKAEYEEKSGNTQKEEKV